MLTNQNYYKNKQIVTMYNKSINNCEVLGVGIKFVHVILKKWWINSFEGIFSFLFIR